MHDDKRRAESRSEIDRLQSLFDRALAFPGVRRGELVAIGRRTHDLDRERAEIVQAAELHPASVVHLLDSRHERDADSVAELDVFETKMDDLLQHLVTVGVARRVPAGG